MGDEYVPRRAAARAERAGAIVETSGGICGMMGRVKAPFPAAIALAAFLVAPNGRAQEPDPWWGKDKALHFGASATLAAGGYAVGAAVFDTRLEALALGGGVALGAGVGKEVADAAGLGDPSWRDFAWDAIGTAVGLGVAWTVDLLVGPRESAHGSARSGGRGRDGAIVIRF